MVAARRARERQRGSVLVAVMVFMALLSLFATTLVNHLMVSEATEVESLLAETRVHWAMTGQLNYMLSRAAGQGLCTAGTKGANLNANEVAACNDENDETSGGYPSFTGRTKGSRAGALQDYLDGTSELQNGTIDAPGSLTWYYPQNANADNSGKGLNDASVVNAANSYWFAVRGVVSERVLSTSLGARDGQLRLDLDVYDAGTVPVLSNIAHRVGRLTVGFCVTDRSGGNGAGGGTLTADDTSACAGNVSEGTSRIQFIQRNFPFSF